MPSALVPRWPLPVFPRRFDAPLIKYLVAAKGGEPLAAMAAAFYLRSGMGRADVRLDQRLSNAATQRRSSTGEGELPQEEEEDFSSLVGVQRVG